MKVTPLIEEMKRHRRLKPVLVHTEQHLSKGMSKVFFEEVSLPEPHANFSLGLEERTSKVEKLLRMFKSGLRLLYYFRRENPELVVVVGDTVSTLIGAVAAKLAGAQLAHVEAGLRSFNLRMVEEKNRIVVDRLSDYLFTTEEAANKNLRKEGISADKVFFVGNVMVDTLLKNKRKAVKSKILGKLGLEKKKYGVLTLHRAETIDDKHELSKALDAVSEVQKKIKLIWPMHPRTKKKISEFSLIHKVESMQNLVVTEPLGYLDFLHLMANSKFVLTDSGGIQEETTVLGVPCITMRNETERPVTVTQGTNVITGTDASAVKREVEKILAGHAKKGRRPKYWDGRAARRICSVLIREVCEVK